MTTVNKTRARVLPLSLMAAIEDILSDADDTGCDGCFVVSAAVIDRAQQALDSQKALLQQDKPISAIKQVREALAKDAGGNGKATMNDLDFACRMLDELMAMRSRPSEKVVVWWNHCDESVPAALRYLAEHERPAGGNSSFNSEHLHMLADEIELMASRPMYAGPQPPLLDMQSVQRAFDVTAEFVEQSHPQTETGLARYNALRTILDLTNTFLRANGAFR